MKSKGDLAQSSLLQKFGFWAIATIISSAMTYYPVIIVDSGILVAYYSVLETGFFPLSSHCNEVSCKNPVSGHPCVQAKFINDWYIIKIEQSGVKAMSNTAQTEENQQ